MVGCADPVDDARTLDKFAVWALDFSPLVSADQPDGLWIDATGTDHLFGGEQEMLNAIVARLQKSNLTAHVAIADTPGSAWACAHYGNEGVIKSSDTKAALLHLPVAALRLKNEAVDGLRRVGVRTVDDLLRLPRKTIPHRFSRDVVKRLDQALGLSPETISPVLPPESKCEILKFAEPIATREGLEKSVNILCERLCQRLELVAEGAKRLDLVFERVDNTNQGIRVVPNSATRDPKHIARMFIEHLENVDPGFGIELITLTANMTELTVPKQINALAVGDADSRDLTVLTDRLSNRHGHASLYKASATQSGIPERSVRRVSVNSEATGKWLKAEHRPIHLYEPPEHIEVTAMMPDHPPLMFRWRNKVHKVKRAEAPERIREEWWAQSNERPSVRDYFKVEDDEGKRYWIFRDNRANANGVFAWYMHGVFA